MAKSFQDIIPPKKSIRQIPIPERTKKTAQAETDKVLNTVNLDDSNSDIKMKYSRERSINDFSLDNNQTRKGPKIIIWLMAFVALFFLFASLSWVLEETNIDIETKKVELDVNDVFTFKKGVNAEYSTVEFEIKESMDVSGSGSKEVSTKASGTILIQNTWSASPQKLIANTRFESTSGKIFRIEKAVTVPGRKNSGKEIIPGTIEVSITAEKPGDEYNVGLSDFTIPGFKDDPRFNTIIARSKTPIKGGALGTVAIVSDKDLATAKESMEKKLKERAVADARTNIPPEFVMPNDLWDINYEQNTPTPSGDNKAKFEIVAKFKGYILNEKYLIETISREKVQSEIKDGDLELSFDNLKFSKEIKGDDLLVKIIGKTTVSPKIHVEDLITNIVGKKKMDAEKIISEIKSIEKIKISVRPFWKGSLPKSPKKIKFTIK